MRWPSRRLALGLVAGFFLLEGLRLPAITEGDAWEYLLMAESLFHHGSPDVRVGDVRALGSLSLRFGVPMDFSDVEKGYFESPRGGKYCYHFFGYSLLTLPAKAIFHAFHLNELKAPTLTNALLLLFALARSLAAGGERGWGLFGLSLFSPVLFFVRWPHTEVMSFAFVTLALLFREEGRGRVAILAAAVAAMQNPPLVFLVLALWLQEVLETRSGRSLVLSSLAALPVLFPAVFFFFEFGTPSLIGREGASLSRLSLWRTYELFFDWNIGMLPFIPLALGLFFFVLVRSRASVPLRNAGLLFLLALASTVTLNWNHGTSGPSRYTLWMLPLVFEGVLPPGPLHVPRFLLALAIVMHGGIAFLHGGIGSVPDYRDHSFAARQILKWAPRLYNPSPEIFVARTLHQEEASPKTPVVYKDGGRCRKALVRPEDREVLLSACGELPTLAGKGWRYVDF